MEVGIYLSGRWNALHGHTHRLEIKWSNCISVRAAGVKLSLMTLFHLTKWEGTAEERSPGNRSILMVSGHKMLRNRQVRNQELNLNIKSTDLNKVI